MQMKIIIIHLSRVDGVMSEVQNHQSNLNSHGLQLLSVEENHLVSDGDAMRWQSDFGLGTSQQQLFVSQCSQMCDDQVQKRD